jgi:hypothetical protein
MGLFAFKILANGIHSGPAISLNKSKCKFLQSSVVYLGHLTDSAGLHSTEDKLAAVCDAPPPSQGRYGS